MLTLLLMAASLSTNQVRCVSTSDRIEITLPAAMDPKIGSMAVVSGKRWVTLVDETHRLAPYGPGVRRLVLRPSRQRAVNYGEDGAERVVRAFPRPGTYRIVFSDNLETEPENMTLRDCLVRIR